MFTFTQSLVETSLIGGSYYTHKSRTWFKLDEDTVCSLVRTNSTTWVQLKSVSITEDWNFWTTRSSNVITMPFSLSNYQKIIQILDWSYFAYIDQWNLAVVHFDKWTNTLSTSSLYSSSTQTALYSSVIKISSTRILHIQWNTTNIYFTYIDFDWFWNSTVSTTQTLSAQDSAAIVQFENEVIYDNKAFIIWWANAISVYDISDIDNISYVTKEYFNDFSWLTYLDVDKATWTFVTSSGSNTQAFSYSWWIFTKWTFYSSLISTYLQRPYFYEWHWYLNFQSSSNSYLVSIEVNSLDITLWWSTTIPTTTTITMNSSLFYVKNNNFLFYLPSYSNYWNKWECNLLNWETYPLSWSITRNIVYWHAINQVYITQSSWYSTPANTSITYTVNWTSVTPWVWVPITEALNIDVVETLETTDNTVRPISAWYLILANYV